MATSRPIKRELAIYGTARTRAKFEKENAVALLGQIKGIWPSLEPLDLVEVTKTENFSILF